MRFVVALVLLAACGATPATPSSEPPRLRVLACTRPPALPVIPTEDHVDGMDTADAYGDLIGGELGGILGAATLSLQANIAIGAAPRTARVGPSPMRRHLRERLDEMRECYVAAQQTDKALHGRVVATFTVDRAGAATGIVVDGPSALAACVKAGLSDLRVPPPSDPAAVFEYPFEFGSTQDAPTSFMTGDPPSPWMPFASFVDQLDDARLASVARATETAMRQRLVELEACFPPDAPTGSLRTISSFWEDGGTAYVRAGGLGAYAVERCVADVLDDLRLGIHPNSTVELACDLARGDAAPWRLAAENYRVVEVTAREAPAPDELDDELVVALVVAPDAPAANLTRALARVSDSVIALIATRDAKGALTYVAPGRIARSVSAGEDDSPSPHPSLVVHAGSVTACLRAHTRTAKLTDDAGVAALVDELQQLCKRSHCASTLGIAHAPGVPLRDVLAVAAAARRAGHQRVLLDAFSTCRDRSFTIGAP